MIEVIIRKNKAGKYIGFNVSGHAGYAQSGHDIVCAATSALVINTVNSIETLTETQSNVSFEEKTGIINLDFKSDLCIKAEVLMDSLVLGLKAIREDNEKYIKISIKEV